MTLKTYFLLSLFGGWIGLHKFATGNFKMGIIYLFTCGLFGLGWLYDTVKAGIALINSRSYGHINSVSRYDSTREKADKYFSNVATIESMWSVMHNLKIINGDKANSFEALCKQNILELYDMLDYNKETGYDSSVPPHVPAYVRLSMLYEKQERYEDAINICVEAIKAGAVEDGNKGKMYGRLARLLKKSGITANDEILNLVTKG